MYVQCERCQAEYEFDDALVSERGTTVKCTSCGHQFKIKRSGAGEGDRWTVQTQDGRSLVFSSLKELQRAIVAKTVSRNDSLSRSGSPTKTLGSIAELEPFFEERGRRNPSVPDGRPMLASTRPPPPLPNSLPPPPGGSPSLAAPRKPMRSSHPSMPPPLPARAQSMPPIDGTGPLSPMKKGAGDGGPWSGDDTPTHALRREAPASPPAVAPKRDERNGRSGPPPRPPRPSAPERERDGEARAETRSRPERQEHTEPLPPAGPPRISASDALRSPSPSLVETYSHPGRRRVGGWVVGVALLAGVAGVGFYMMSRGGPSAGPNAGTNSSEADPRVKQFLSSGEGALAQGNLELAKENFDKASALAERNPDVLLGLARLTASRADIAWLRQKLAAPNSDEARVNQPVLDELAAAARRSADDAQKGAPEDAGLVRARIDALRISGDARAARTLVDKILPTGSQPETAYVLAALDLAENDPPWTVVISRLRAAAAGEGAASRARAALVYALARSGDGPEARKELDRLAAQPRVHPLLPALRSFVDRVAPVADAGAPVVAKPAESVAAVDVNRLPASTQSPAPVGPTPNNNPGPTSVKPPTESTGGAGAGAALSSDPRTLIRQAEAAKGKRDYDRARTLYEAALAKSPSDSEALGGLGDVLRAQGDVAGAQGVYKRALGVNPSYLPALIALADLQWDQGDKGGAQKAYRDIVDRFPEPAYPARVKTRAEGTGGGAAPPKSE